MCIRDSLYGFARADYIFDSRKSAYVREYNLNLYPLDVVKDTNGCLLYTSFQNTVISNNSGKFSGINS